MFIAKANIHLFKHATCSSYSSINKYKCRYEIVKNNHLIITCPATNYVAATFHPTIGQCAHQYLSNASTPNMGMIPTWNKGTTSSSHIAKYTSKFSQAKTKFGFIRLLRSWKDWTTKIVRCCASLAMCEPVGFPLPLLESCPTQGWQCC